MHTIVCITFTHQERPLTCSQLQPNHYTASRNSKIPRTTIRLQVKLERTRRQKKKTNRLKNKIDRLVSREKIPSLYRKQITHLESGNQTYMELRSRTVGLRQQFQYSHHAQITIQNSLGHSKCTLLRNKSYPPYRLHRPLRK
jgi:hypothetical protein